MQQKLSSAFFLVSEPGSSSVSEGEECGFGLQRAEITSGLDKLLEEHNEQRQRGFFSKEFREGELRIRHILLGVSGHKAFTGAEPDNRSTAAALAAKVPYWAM